MPGREPSKIPTVRCLLPTEPERHARNSRQGKTGRAVNSRHDRRIGRDPRLEVVLRFVIVPVEQVVEAEVEFDATGNLLRHPEIEYRVP